MKHYAALAIFFAYVCTAIAETPPRKTQPDAPQAPAAQVSASATRYAELPLTEFQTRVMNEATKLSLACRYFRSLYGRWPKNIAEIQSKTEGIDYGVFIGKEKVTPLKKEDAAQIEVFDGENTRSVKAVPVDFSITKEQKAAARKPDFKIKL